MEQGMDIRKAAVIGFGATGAPIAHLMGAMLGNGFRLVATGARREGHGA